MNSDLVFLLQLEILLHVLRLRSEISVGVTMMETMFLFLFSNEEACFLQFERIWIR